MSPGQTHFPAALVPEMLGEFMAGVEHGGLIGRVDNELGRSCPFGKRA